ncbi:NADH-ubiquinone oxidoreductase-F iron-sulfur binding region domain-containing protein [Proteocatella sphenisci]|uniref:NADH-ubiquinone oxidoreductase-F iron-sulfur binding region domain-containing protein n=1 Tax=Proteocatella sphenisci TaxID=181070 RepID=UPI0004B60A35|nr:NADH-ubiquinone oxidoreductase-F iron-sulfur binding region domain-containing protein [Proteocatella sphenisci]
MNDYTILNLVPVYREAPVSCELFKNKTEESLRLLAEKNPNNNYLIINKKESEKLNLKERYSDLMENIKLVETEYTDGFVFSNRSAASKIIEGEKPIPCSMERVESLEELMESEKKMVFVFGSAENKGMHDLNRKITGKEILDIAGSISEFKGIYLGYPMGRFIFGDTLNEEIELKTDYIEIYDETSCMIDSLLNISKRFLNESCGKCVFGYEGTSQISMILNDISMKKGKSDDLELLMNLCSQMKTQCLCDTGSCMAESVMSCIESFKEEITEHVNKKDCRALVCSRFVTYHILADKCTGCTECLDACDDDAILGKKKFIHVIDQDECVQCGRCLDACDEGAITRCGSVKPKSPSKPIPCKAK